MSTETFPQVTVATSTNRAGTVSVQATDQGLPVEINVDKRELRFGATALADEILQLCKRAALEAGARRRDDLAASGVPADVLNRLGLPTRDAVVERNDAAEAEESAPNSWMRPV